LHPKTEARDNDEEKIAVLKPRMKGRRRRRGKNDPH
jgi:hypothetical protein